VNRGSLEVERVSHYCVLTQEALDRLKMSPPAGGQSDSAPASRRCAL